VKEETGRLGDPERGQAFRDARMKRQFAAEAAQCGDRVEKL
jgi:hypothetical protein